MIICCHIPSPKPPQFVAFPQHIIIFGNFQVHFLKSSYDFRDRNLEAILTDPARCFNSDKTFGLSFPGKEKVLAPTRTKDVYLVHKSSVKSGVSVLATFLFPVGFCILSSSIRTNGLNDGWIRTTFHPESNLFLRKKCG
jgi:hypothetical protein